ncbi:MAG: ParB/RepB/Spo0J family partition protein [Acidobacteriota bacterium]
MSEAATRRGKKKRGLPSRVQMRASNHFVDELVARSEPAVGKMVALEQVEPDPAQPRNDFDGIEELVQSVSDRGVLEPILVRPLGEAGAGPYRIISGERRFRAATQAGLLEIPAIVMDVDDREALEIALVENLQRKDLNAFEEAEGYAALAEQYSYTHEEISKAVGKSRTVVTESFSLLQIQPEARRAAIGFGVTSKSLLLEVLRRATDEEDQITLLERIAREGLKRADLRAEAPAQKKRSAGPREKPHVFRFKGPEKQYSLNISIRKETVEPSDLIRALEATIAELKAMEVEGLERLLGKKPAADDEPAT